MGASATRKQELQPESGGGREEEEGTESDATGLTAGRTCRTCRTQASHGKDGGEKGGVRESRERGVDDVCHLDGRRCIPGGDAGRDDAMMGRAIRLAPAWWRCVGDQH